MTAAHLKQLRWIKQVQVPALPAERSSSLRPLRLTSRDRLVAALAERPRTVAQLAQAFGLSQPTMLEQVRRALGDGLIVEVDVAPEERRFAAERYYAPAVPVVRAPDVDLLESACRAAADDVAAVLTTSWSDLLAAFSMTHLAREGWTIDDLWPYLHETIHRLVREQIEGAVTPAAIPHHGLAWIEEIEEIEEIDAAVVRHEEQRA